MLYEVITSREWLTGGDMFDATMHYVLSRNLWKRFAGQRHHWASDGFL